MPRSAVGLRTIRLQGHDYTRPGWNFVTTCTHERRRMLCSIRTGRVFPTDVGRIVIDAWRGLTDRFPHARFDRFILMPDHFHGIISVHWPDPRAEAPSSEFGRGIPGSLATIVGSFKSASTRLIHASDFARGRIWRRNYYERIIRDEQALIAVRRYIAHNPVNWGRR